MFRLSDPFGKKTLTKENEDLYKEIVKKDRKIREFKVIDEDVASAKKFCEKTGSTIVSINKNKKDQWTFLCFSNQRKGDSSCYIYAINSNTICDWKKISTGIASYLPAAGYHIGKNKDNGDLELEIIEINSDGNKGLGYGSMIIQWIKEEARDCKCKRVVGGLSYVDASIIKGRETVFDETKFKLRENFYEKNGFKVEYRDQIGNGGFSFEINSDKDTT